MAQNDKIFCFLCSLFQELCIHHMIIISLYLQAYIIISSGVFLHCYVNFYFNFHFNFWGQLGCNGKKWPKMAKSCTYRTPYINMIRIFSVQWCHLHFFFYFKILIFQVVREVKGQKMTQIDKKFSLSHSVSQEPYLIWLWFLVHMYKMMISPAIFFIFSKLWFCLFFGGWDKREENGP